MGFFDRFTAWLASLFAAKQAKDAAEGQAIIDAATAEAEEIRARASHSDAVAGAAPPPSTPTDHTSATAGAAPPPTASTPPIAPALPQTAPSSATLSAVPTPLSPRSLTN